MSYIAFDLDALNVARDVGAAAGIPEERVTHGLLRMWAWCFREKTEHIDAVQVRGFFGSDAAPALVSFGFLAADGEVFRVRGAQRYLRVAEARRRGAEKTNAAKRERGVSDAPSTLERRSSDAQATLNRALPSALTPSTEHRAPSTEHRKAAAGPMSLATPEGFWTACQDKRDAIPGMVRETPPARLDHWFSEAMMQVNGDEQRLLAGYEQFLVDPFWRNEATRRCHWGGWVKQWRDFVSRAASPVTTRSSTKAPVAAESVDWSTVTPGEVDL